MSGEENERRIARIEQMLEEVEKERRELQRLKLMAMGVLNELQTLSAIPTSREKYLLSEETEEEKPLDQMTLRELLDREEELKHPWRKKEEPEPTIMDTLTLERKMRRNEDLSPWDLKILRKVLLETQN